MDMFVGSTKLKAKGMAARARAVEKKASKQGKVLKKKLESGAKKAFSKAPAKAKMAAKKKITPPKKKAAASKVRSRAKK